MSKSASVYGFSVSPTHVSGVRLSLKDFSVETAAQLPLPPATISHDAKRILDTQTLVAIIRDVLEQLGDPAIVERIFVSIYPNVLHTQTFSLADNERLDEIVAQRASQEGLISPEDHLLVQSHLIAQHGNMMAVCFTGIGESVLKSYADVFSQAGVWMWSADIIPLSVVRSLAASGVLDAMVARFGDDVFWGCFGVCGSQTWAMLWEGTALLKIDGFITPSEQGNWEAMLVKYSQVEGYPPPKLWLVWQEYGTNSAIDPLRLKLNAPTYPAKLGPFYDMGRHLSFPALGAALKIEVQFPLGWDFLKTLDEGVILTEILKPTPIEYHKPLIPKFILRLGLAAFTLVLMATAVLLLHNGGYLPDQWHTAHQREILLQGLADRSKAQIRPLYWIQSKKVVHVELSGLYYSLPKDIELWGLIYDDQNLKDYIEALTKVPPGEGFTIKAEKFDTRPVVEPQGPEDPGLSKFQQFNILGHIQYLKTEDGFND